MSEARVAISELRGQFKDWPHNARACSSTLARPSHCSTTRRTWRNIPKIDGVDVTLSVVDGMQHVFPFLAARAAAADEELHRIPKWFKGAQALLRKRRPVRTEP
jgi:hypothetical protein